MQIEKASAALRNSLNRKMRKMDNTDEQGASHEHRNDTPEECKIDKHRCRTVTLINLAGVMERMDEQASQHSFRQSSCSTLVHISIPGAET